MRNKVLLIEQTPEKREQLASVLEGANYFVAVSASAEKALDRLWQARPDMVILSSELSGMSGLQFCTYVRGDARLKRLPLMLISGPLPSDALVRYLRAGVDDHIQYDMAQEEILARAHALLRRVYAADADAEVLEGAGVRLLVDERRVISEGRDVALTRKEFDLLRALMSRGGKVVSTGALLSSVWGYAKDVSTKTLQVHINHLRKKLGAPGAAIKNFSGVGYAFSTAPTNVREQGGKLH